MAARAQNLFAIPLPAEDVARAAQPSALATLSALHAEAVETARLANLLGRSLYAIIALPALGALTLALADAGTAETIAWGILMGFACLALARAYAHAIHQPFERAALHGFAQDLSAGLLYAGFAWGAGAFLALTPDTTGFDALAFAAAPSLLLAALLRERQAVLLFVAPVAGLTSLACVMRPFASGTMGAGVVLVACAILAWALHATARGADKRALPTGLVAS
ncbi:MAG TPA: hypothetical protein VG387_16120 [Rhizomicrobium sp.]|jgi:hypothetical protein|nr:hypothetical protein [Rhizomicrobium sp.]